MQQVQNKDSYISELEQKKQNDIDDLTKIKEKLKELMHQSPEVQQSQNQISQKNSDSQEQSISQGTQAQAQGSLNNENDEEQFVGLYQYSGVENDVKQERSAFNISQILKLEYIRVSPSLLNSYINEIDKTLNQLIKEQAEFRISGIYQKMQEKVEFYQNSTFLDIMEQVEQKSKNLQGLTDYQIKLKEDMLNNALQDSEQIAEFKFLEKLDNRIIDERKLSKIKLKDKDFQIPEKIFKKLHQLELQIHQLYQYPPLVQYTDALKNQWVSEQKKQLAELKQVVLTMRYCWLFIKKSKIFFPKLQKFLQMLCNQV